MYKLVKIYSLEKNAELVCFNALISGTTDPILLKLGIMVARTMSIEFMKQGWRVLHY